MQDNPDINPIWDTFMGETTNVAMIRVIVAILLFVIIGGVVAWAIA